MHSPAVPMHWKCHPSHCWHLIHTSEDAASPVAGGASLQREDAAASLEDAAASLEDAKGASLEDAKGTSLELAAKGTSLQVSASITCARYTASKSSQNMGGLLQVPSSNRLHHLPSKSAQ